jgi:hypothetical protein
MQHSSHVKALLKKEFADADIAVQLMDLSINEYCGLPYDDFGGSAGPTYFVHLFNEEAVAHDMAGAMRIAVDFVSYLYNIPTKQVCITHMDWFDNGVSFHYVVQDAKWQEEDQLFKFQAIQFGHPSGHDKGLWQAISFAGSNVEDIR